MTKTVVAPAHVSGLYHYPVKSMRGHSVETAGVERIGLADDRRIMLVDENDRFITQREMPALAQWEAHQRKDSLTLHHEGQEITVALPGESSLLGIVRVWKDHVQARDFGKEVSDWCSTRIGKAVRLVALSRSDVRPTDPAYSRVGDHVSFADGFPILLTSRASLEDLNVRAECEIDMRRFRPNIVVDGTLAWQEDTWRLIQIGNVRFRVVKPCSRCVVTTLDPETGEQIHPREPLATLGRFHRDSRGAIIFGQNLIPEGIGQVSTGDIVEVLETGPSNLKSED